MQTEFHRVKLGAIFFDPFSGEKWQKVGERQARLITGGDFGLVNDSDEFDLYEIVELKS